MTESAYSTTRGAEISERSTELVLPGGSPSVTRDMLRGRENGVSEAEASHRRSDGVFSIGRSDDEASASAASGAPTAPATASAPGFQPRGSTLNGVSRTAATAATLAPSETPEAPARPRGAALPGDRGPRDQPSQAAPTQRPSFWRRIALGRRASQAEAAPPDAAQSPRTTRAPDSSRSPDSSGGDRALEAASPATARLGRHAPLSPPQTPPGEMLEKRIVEPMLQALVSVEAKLERSHADLSTRSDHVEQRLTQLWDIEEQLGALGELQESLLQVSEQQRRLESAVVSQTRTLRWLVAGIFCSLAGAAFVVAAVLR